MAAATAGTINVNHTTSNLPGAGGEAMMLRWIALFKRRKAEREQREALEWLIATDGSAAKEYRRQKRDALRQRIERRVRVAGAIVVLAFVLLLLVGMLLAWLDLLPPSFSLPAL